MKNPRKKQKKKKKSESEDEEEEDEKPKKKAKTTKKGKKKTEDDEDEKKSKTKKKKKTEDDDEETPKTKKKKKTEDDDEDTPKTKAAPEPVEEEEEKKLNSTPNDESKKVMKKEEDDTTPDDFGDFPFGLEWTTDGTFSYFDSPKLKGKSKVLGFDMDSTLIEPKSGAKWPKSRVDWKWWKSVVPTRLKEWYNKGYKIVIFTNQGGIEKKKQELKHITGKILDITEKLSFPVQAFVAHATNIHRKPNTTMWDFFVTNCNKGVDVDLKESFYIGDAGGRLKGWRSGAKKDFSCSDRSFAFNVGIGFKTPEEFFLDEAATKKFSWGCLDAAAYLKDAESKGLKEFEGSSITSDKQEMLIFVGMPASGKSSFAKKYLEPKGYVWINRDTLKTPAKCLKAAEAALEKGKSVVIDNTSPTTADRANYINLAKEASVPVRCFVFELSRELANHLNFFREKVTDGDRRRVPDVGFNVYKSKFQQPTMKDGYKEICTVRFVPKFTDEATRRLFLQRT